MKIFDGKEQRNIENGNWRIFVFLQDEFGTVGFRSELRSCLVRQKAQKHNMPAMTADMMVEKN